MLKTAMVQMTIQDGDVNRNLAEAGRMIKEAASGGAEVVCLPEMWPTGFDYSSVLKEAEPVPGKFSEFLSQQASENNICLIGGSVPEREAGSVYNTALVYGSDGLLLASYRKIHLFTLMKEHKYLAGGHILSTFNLSDTTAGLLICYDIRFPELTRALTAAGAKIFFHPAEFPHPRLHHWRTLIQARAIENQAWMVSTNRVGPGGNNMFFGHSMIVDPWGEVVVEGGEEEGIISFSIDLSKTDTVRSSLTALDDIRHDIFNLHPRT